MAIAVIKSNEDALLFGVFANLLFMFIFYILEEVTRYDEIYLLPGAILIFPDLCVYFYLLDL